ncbi:hypothetical protein BU25DRAFT_405663 [Macroventuria anomochaeta]|uniref:Uncharacterized protein n=1 Tax=Macroventuria anomochaeta TaxID=301207 RepID=A0ACB6SII0_9PLEO|nr:uncharacterized protein BU25DRAFT_405663 [Macroventuria anomochaeta]KAF2633808.1 hypothetical protein BU25DRAFT_405663 [Macroventuria anomochaeta]
MRSTCPSRRYALSGLENFDFVVSEKVKHFKEFAKNDNFNQVLQPGIYARYSELVMGHNLSDDCTMPSAWLDLTITSVVKHEKTCKSYYVEGRADHSMSTGLWYGDKTIQRSRFPETRGILAMATGATLEMDNASALNIPMGITVPKFLVYHES